MSTAPFRRLRADIRCILERDPAARSAFEVLTLYPGLHALILHRGAHALWLRGLRWPARFVAHVARWLTGIEIHPAARIGEGVFFDHAMGVVVGETAEIGDGCTIYQGVTLGGTSLYRGTKRHPTLGRGVVVGAGAKVLGGFTVGDGARIGSNAVVTKPVPAGATAVGNPARIVRGASNGGEVPASGAPASGPLAERSPSPQPATDARGFAAYGVTQADDPVSQALRGLIDSAAGQDHQIALLWRAIETLADRRENAVSAKACIPAEAARDERFEADALNRLVDR